MSSQANLTDTIIILLTINFYFEFDSTTPTIHHAYYYKDYS